MTILTKTGVSTLQTKRLLLLTTLSLTTTLSFTTGCQTIGQRTGRMNAAPLTD